MADKTLIKVLLFSPLPPPRGGMATWTEEYLKYISTSIEDIEVVLVDTSVFSNTIFNNSIINELIRNCRIIKNTIKLCLSHHFSIAHLNSPCNNWGIIRDFILCKILSMFNINIIFHAHCDISKMTTSKYSKHFLKKCLEKSKLVYVLNDNSFDFINDFRIESKCVVINNFIDINEIMLYRQEVKKKMKKLCFVGHFIESKGSKEFLEISKKMKTYEFNVYGFTSQETMEDLNNKNITFFGNIDRFELFRQLADNDLLLFLSHHEGLPLTILEASCLNIAIISTDVGDISKIIDEECLVSVGDIDGIIAKINRFENYETRMKIVNNNFKSIIQNYNVQKIVDSIIEDYRKLE